MKLTKQSFFYKLASNLALYFILLTSFWAVLAPQTARAAAANTSLYSASVPIGSEGEVAAFKEALKEVFIKVSGQSQIIDQAAIQQALQQANNWAVRYQTIASPFSTDENATQAPWLKVDFDPKQVNSRIEQAGFQVYRGSRGPVLVWLMLDHAGTPIVLNENDGTYQDWVILFKQAAQARGMTVIFPILDLYEGTQLDLFSMKALDQEALKKASQRYHNTHFLAGYLQENADEWHSKWVLNQAAISSEWQTSAASKAELMQAVVARFADEWMKNAQPAVAAAQDDSLTLTVENVETLEVYTQIWRGLEKLNAVSTVDPIALSRNTAVFTITLQGSAEDLMQGLLTEAWLVPTNNISATTTQLYYRYAP